MKGEKKDGLFKTVYNAIIIDIIISITITCTFHSFTYCLARSKY